MFQNRKYLAGLATLLLFFAPICSADTFDQAVNKYLQGFEYCNDAKEQMNDGRLSQASNSLKKYLKVKEQAVGIDPSILTSSRREMDSNLKYCERVAKDIEIQLGMPTLDKAIAACESSRQALKDMSPDVAREHYQQFQTLRDKALSVAPSLQDLFSARSRINRCNRFEKKITSYQKEQEESSRLVEAAVDNSENYAATCTETAGGLGANSLNRQNLKAVKNNLSSIRELKTVATGDEYVLELLATPPFSDHKKLFDSNLAAGDECVGKLETQVAAQEREINQYKSELAVFARDLSKLDSRCDAVAKGDPKSITQSRYQELSRQYDSVVAERNRVQSRLNQSSVFKQAQDWPEARKINSSLAALNRCIEQSNKHLAVLFRESGGGAKVVATKPKPVVKSKAVAQAGFSPADTIKGTINVVGSTPQLAIVYLLSSEPEGDTRQIVITPSGFDKRYYMVGPEDTIRVKSRDFAFHRTSINIPGVDYPNDFLFVQSRQQKEVKVDWPTNTIAILRSDRASIVPAFIANIPTRDFSMLKFDSADGSSSFELATGGKQGKGYILMSGFDPIPFELSKGQTEAMDVVRDSTVSGNVLLQGL